MKHGHIFKANLLNWITIYVNNGEFWHILQEDTIEEISFEEYFLNMIGKEQALAISKFVKAYCQLFQRRSIGYVELSQFVILELQDGQVRIIFQGAFLELVVHSKQLAESVWDIYFLQTCYFVMFNVEFLQVYVFQLQLFDFVSRDCKIVKL